MSTCLCCGPGLFGRRGFLAISASAAALPAWAQSQSQSKSAGPADPALLEDLVAANRILYDQGVVDGFGHVSVRHDKDPNRYLLSRSMAPALVTVDDILEYDLDSNPVDPRGRTSYLERFIHGELYKARPDIIAVVHSHSPAVIPFADSSVPLRPMNHIAGFLGAGVPVFEIRDTAGPATDMLIRNASLGHALALTLGTHSVALMRGHGSIAAAQSIRHVVFRAVYTEVNARMQAGAMILGTPKFLSPEEAAAAEKTNDGLVDRPWALWKQHAMGKA
ncbi:MAG TPA: class II aldolase/adducin family protein [Rhodopila sp.]|nr:class II aldolase/adducin family protein [Rhodopila sp.]